jgi:CDP-glucose 4,6-dehydratase
LGREKSSLEGLALMNFWKDKKVFLTGHTGFKGAWLTLMLHHLGAKVTGYSLDVPTDPSVYELTNCAGLLVKDHRGDIRDFEKLKSALDSSGAEIVFHLAAQPLVRLSYADPFNTYGSNVMGTLNVLLACHQVASVKSIVNITTDKCYENHEVDRGYIEGDQLGGHDPYSSSKACAEIVSSSMRSSFLAAANKHLSTARAGNVIGGGDWAMDRIIPDMMRAHLAGEKLVLRNPKATRPWQHVMEPLKVYLTLAEKNYQGPEFTEAFNIGPEKKDNRTVLEVVNTLLTHLPGHPGVDSTGTTKQVHEANLLMLDCTKLKTRLGWQPKINLDEALKLTGEWYRAQFEKKDMREFTLKQIREFLA